MARRRACCVRSQTDPVRTALGRERRAQAALAKARRSVVKAITAAINNGCTVPAIASRIVDATGDPAESLHRRRQAAKAIHARLRRADLSTQRRRRSGSAYEQSLPSSAVAGQTFGMRPITKKTTKTTTEEVVYYGDEPVTSDGLGMADQISLLGDAANAECDGDQADQLPVNDSATTDDDDDTDTDDSAVSDDDLDNNND